MRRSVSRHVRPFPPAVGRRRRRWLRRRRRPRFARVRSGQLELARLQRRDGVGRIQFVGRGEGDRCRRRRGVRLGGRWTSHADGDRLQRVLRHRRCLRRHQLALVLVQRVLVEGRQLVSIERRSDQVVVPLAADEGRVESRRRRHDDRSDVGRRAGHHHHHRGRAFGPTLHRRLAVRGLDVARFPAAAVAGRVQLSIVTVGVSLSRAEAGQAVPGPPPRAVPDEEGGEDEYEGNCDGRTDGRSERHRGSERRPGPESFPTCASQADEEVSDVAGYARAAGGA